MIRRSKPQARRRGVTVVECAVVFPLLFLLVIGVIVGGLGVFRYQELAALSREAARWASVRGYAREFNTGQKPPTEKEVYEQVIAPKAVALDLRRLKYSVTWDPDQRQGSQVVVRLDYHWIPELFFGGIDLSSTSSMLMSY